MRKDEIWIREVPEELAGKIEAALEAVKDQKMRYMRCPYCMRNTIAVYEDTSGHVRSKCPRCGRESVYDTVNMHRSAKSPVRMTY